MIIEFKTEQSKLAKAIVDFETRLPGWWWSIGQCSVGAHASCGVDRQGVVSHLLSGVGRASPFDAGFHCDTQGGQPHEALKDVMHQAVEYLASLQQQQGSE